MYDSLTQRSQPPADYMRRLERFCLQYAWRLRQQAECIKGDSARERVRRKAEEVADLARSMRLN